MICPKCGFDQQGDQECLKCGVVFAKVTRGGVRRREESGQTASATPAAVMDYPPTEALNLNLQGIKEDGKRVWDEIHYLKADRDLTKEVVDVLRQRAEDLTQALTHCAQWSDVQPVTESLSNLSTTVASLNAQIGELSGAVHQMRHTTENNSVPPPELEQLRAEIHQAAGTRAALDDTQRVVALISGEVDALRARVVEKLDHIVTDDGWNHIVSGLRSELDTFRSELRHTWDTLRTLSEHDAEHQRLTAEVHDLKGEVAELRSHLSELKTLAQGWSNAERGGPGETGRAQLDAWLASADKKLWAPRQAALQTELDALRRRCEILEPKLAELDGLKESLAGLTRSANRPQPLPADLTGLAPRVEALEAFHKTVTQTMEKISGPGSPETQLEALQKWSERLRSTPAARPVAESAEDLRELKDDISAIKGLLSDFIIQGRKDAQ